LLIASQYTFEFRRKAKDDNGGWLRQYEQARAQRIVDNPGYNPDDPVALEEEKVDSDALMAEAMGDDKFEDVEENETEETTTNSQEAKREKEYAKKEQSTEWVDAKRRWKDENPGEHIKEWKQAYIKGDVDEVPWEKYLEQGTAKRYIFKDKEEQHKDIALQETYQQNAEQNESTIWNRLKRDKD
jgi:hypothetical protein